MAKALNQIFESFTSVMDLLRNPQFQDLLENYERGKTAFLVGYEIQDEVSSEVLFEVLGERDIKPVDYLTAFSEFVKEKETEIDAIAILLNRPQAWNTSALNELREKLKENYFSEYDLRKAHKIVYHKELVDIISMVKHAAKESEPLLSSEERVNKAIQRVIGDKALNPEQRDWIEYIKQHLKQNMTLDENDLRELPVFTDRGGFAKFRRVFPDNFSNLILKINEAIAA
jgi:type I restriction enzyme R subunit